MSMRSPVESNVLAYLSVGAVDSPVSYCIIEADNVLANRQSFHFVRKFQYGQFHNLNELLAAAGGTQCLIA